MATQQTLLHYYNACISPILALLSFQMHALEQLIIPEDNLPLEEQAIIVLKQIYSTPIGASWINLLEKHRIPVSCSFPEHMIIPHSTVKIPKGL